MILFAMAIMCCSIAIAQSETTRTIHGAVVDKNGNPLPGAIVSATEGAETALVNADGTFDLEIPIWLKSVTASYAGYKNKKMKPRFGQDMIFRMKKDKKRYGFLNAFFGVDLYNSCSNTIFNTAPSMGLMGGMLANVGFYVKGGLMFGGDYFGDYYGIGGVAIGGVTKRIYKNLYAYLGVGYGSVLFECENYRSDIGYWYEAGYYDGMAFDGGFIFGIGRHFNISVGYTHTTDFDGYRNCIPNLSLGYLF